MLSDAIEGTLSNDFPSDMKIPAVFLNSGLHILAAVLLTLSFSSMGFAQEFGRFNPGIKWQQINTAPVRVIFPKGMESQASRVANNILYLNLNNRSGSGPKYKKIDLILNNQGVVSNGYVSLMPFRSEFYTTPMQDGFEMGSLPWLDLLSIHEYRHVLQYINMRRGLTNLSWWLMGDAGWNSEIHMKTPAWFFEGEAVANETALTNQGRGRLPSFFGQSRSLLLSGINYSYMKARNGSFRDRVPDSYELGYLLCSYGLDEFGNDLWAKVIQPQSLLKGIIYPFSNALRDYTGMKTKQFYKKALSHYTDKWTTELSQTELSRFKSLSKNTKTVTDYRFAVFLYDGNMLVYKQSFKEAGAIYRITPDGEEEKICTTGISQDPYFTTSGNQITSTEITWDERYSSQSYSDVVIYHTDIYKKTYLTRKQRYFSPAFSPNGKKILVAEVNDLGNCRLKIIDSQTGTVISILPNAENLFYTYPKWDTDGNSIISSARTPSGSMLIIRQMISSGSLTKLTTECNQIIGEVLVTPGSILYTAGYSGINNIYSLTAADGMIRQLTGSAFGACNPAISNDGRRLVYSNAGVKGYSLVSASMDSLLWKPTFPVPVDQISSFDFSYFQAEGGNILDKIPDSTFEVNPYRQWLHPIRIHSWSLMPGITSVGINLTSDNILNNLHAEGELKYYLNEALPAFGAKILYGGLYPVLSVGISRNYRLPDIRSLLDGTETVELISLDDKLSVEAQVPLNFTKGEYGRLASISLGYNYISVKNIRSDFDGSARKLIVNSLAARASFSAIRKKSLQNITTPLGMALEFTANQSIGSTNAAQYQAIADFATQGLLPNHNLVISAGWKYEQDLNPYQFLDLFLYPRGFTIPKSDWMITLQTAYHLPLVYPDLGFWGIFYCSRIRGDVFADCAYATIPAAYSANSDGLFASVGSELIFDTKWFNFAEIPLGIRFSFLLTSDFHQPLKKTRFEVVLPIIRL
jgi:Tol biopolymer transport system component